MSPLAGGALWILARPTLGLVAFGWAWGASCPLSLCGPPPARGRFLCICLLLPPWIGYMIVSIECSLEFFMRWGGLLGSPVAWVWDLSALEVTPT